MSETIVEWKPRPRNRTFIKLSGGRFFTVPEAEGESLEPGTVLHEEDIKRLSRIDQYFRGKDKALRLLSIRARSRYEIENALSGMEIAPEIRSGILEELRELGLIDDARFAREYVDSRIEIKHLGPHRLKFELKKFGVSGSIIDTTIEEAFPEGRQEELAWKIVRKKIGSRKADEKDVRRAIDLLRRKGLDYEIINHVAYELLRQQDRDESFE